MDTGSIVRQVQVFSPWVEPGQERQLTFQVTRGKLCYTPKRRLKVRQPSWGPIDSRLLSASVLKFWCDLGQARHFSHGFLQKRSVWVLGLGLLSLLSFCSPNARSHEPFPAPLPQPPRSERLLPWSVCSCGRGARGTVGRLVRVVALSPWPLNS